MPVTRFDVTRREAYEDGRPFGDAGPYERIDGVLRIAIDPLHPANAGVIDIERAARDADGLVRFDADMTVLQPVDPARANGHMLADIVNRGARTWVAYNLAARDNQRPDWIPPGDGFLLNRGWTIVSTAWQWDVPRGNGLMAMTTPEALEDGQPIEGWVRVPFQPTHAVPDVMLSDRGHRPYAAIDLEQPDARMLVRDYPDAPQREVDRSRWRFARTEGGVAVPNPLYVTLDGGFVAGQMYDIIYRTGSSPITGAGLLAFRDGASYLRYSTDEENPSRGRLTHNFVIGISQSGRLLRSYIEAGANEDEDGRRVFDGLHIHIAGGRSGEFNFRYAQPSVSHPYGMGHRPPFSYNPTVDPVTGATMPGLLDRSRERGVVPKIIATNSATEYWRGDAGMSHIDPSGARDLPDPAEVRVYLFSGVQHGGGQPPLTDHAPQDVHARGGNRFNITHYGPLFRAALINLERWVCDGVEPPPSLVPRVADGTAVTRASVVDVFRAFPTAAIPDSARLWTLPRLDVGSERGVMTTLPPATGERYPTLVSAVDVDGNEVAGIRLPDISVPLATHMGWNPRHPESGGMGQNMQLIGSTVSFAVSAAERATTGDPRPSIEERYASRDAFLQRVRAEGEQLAARGYMLAEDVEVVLKNAADRWDGLVPTTAG